MYHTIKIENYRAFQKLEIAELGQVNLFVGRNNAGKTAILEAVELLVSDHYPNVLLKSPARRQEKIFFTELNKTRIDISHLFTGHHINTDSQFKISGDYYYNHHHYLEARIIEVRDLFGEVPAVQIQGTRLQNTMVITLAELDNVNHKYYIPMRNSVPIQFLGSSGASNKELGVLWDSIVATPEEMRVYEVFSSVLPTLERIVFIASSHVAAFVKLKGMDRLPLGSMGEGVSRLLGLAIYLVKSAGGYLLIDEIDTGLHYSVMEDLWRFIIQTAKQLNVQVFATTHNGDCVRALAWLQQEQPELAKESVLYRIEPNMKKAIRYSAEELEIAARHHIEVRG